MDLLMPKFGGMERGEISKWIKQEGESFEEGAELFEVSTEKLTNVYEAPYAGTLDKIIVEEGEEVDVGVVVGIVTKRN